MAELGVDGMDFPGDVALLAPAATPASVTARLSSAVHTAFRDPKIVGMLRFSASSPVLLTPKMVAAQMTRDFETYSRAAKFAGISPK